MILSSNVFAGPGSSGVSKIALNSTTKIIAVTTESGEYSSIQDLREGFTKFKGLNIQDDKIELLENHEIDSLILDSGEIVSPNIF